ncbi:MAG TPA: hypothetical protein VF586_12500 [Pyrinomonadaceae bacterium]
MVFAAAMTCGLRVFADSWALPAPQKYYSESRRYYVEVIPRALESQLKYFEDKAAKKEPAGSRPGVGNNYCRGVLYGRKEGGAYEKVWEARLSNDVAPVSALVSDGGGYVATFDNWHSVGFGDDVVVIYGPGGRLVRKLALTDIAPTTSIFPRSVSSIFWGGKHYIDERSLQLVLKVLSEWSPHDEEGKYREVRVDLKTGEFVDAKAVAD